MYDILNHPLGIFDILTNNTWERVVQTPKRETKVSYHPFVSSTHLHTLDLLHPPPKCHPLLLSLLHRRSTTSSYIAHVIRSLHGID